MSRIKTFLVHCVNQKRQIPDAMENTLSFISVTNEEVFSSLYSQLGDRFSGLSVAEEHAISVTRILREAFRQRVQYFKVTNASGQIAYCRSSNPFVMLDIDNWGVDLNEMKRCIRKRSKNNTNVDELDIYFDDSYKTFTGLLHDISFWMEIKIELPQMELNDLSVYIARWGGIPGRETLVTPYGM